MNMGKKIILIAINDFDRDFLLGNLEFCLAMWKFQLQ